jgi:hypothetical protein
MTDPTSLPSFPPPPDDHPLRGRVLDALIDEGNQPALDDKGNVVVTVKGQRLLVRCVEGELPMMRVFGQWRIGQSVPADELTRLKVSSELTTRLNLVKVGVQDDVLVVAMDLLVPGDTPLRPVLRSSFVALLNAVRLWHQRAGGVADGGGQGSADD